MKLIADERYGYAYGDPSLKISPSTLMELERLKVSAGLTEDDRIALKLAGEVLADQTKQIVRHWRSEIIASIPHLAQHSRSVAGEPLPEYLDRSNLRFEQWILDTCFRPYDQDWLNYQYEIALRHTSQKKNRTDDVASTPFVPYRDIVAFTAVLNDSIKPYLASKGHSEPEIEAMHRAWCKSLQLQISLWARAYIELGTNEW